MSAPPKIRIDSGSRQERDEDEGNGQPSKAPKRRKDPGSAQKRAAKRKPKRAAPKIRTDRGSKGTRK